MPLTKIDSWPSALNLALISFPIKTRITGSLAAVAFNGAMKNITPKRMVHPDLILGDTLKIKIGFRH